MNTIAQSIPPSKIPVVILDIKNAWGAESSPFSIWSDNKFKTKEKAIVVPFGLEKTVSYGGGTKNGPKEIIKASHQVELYDEELNCEPYKKIGIKTLKPFKIDKNIKNYAYYTLMHMLI